MNKGRLAAIILVSATFLTAMTNYLFVAQLSVSEKDKSETGRYRTSPWLFYRLTRTLDSSVGNFQPVNMSRLAGLLNCSKQSPGHKRVRETTVRRNYTVVTHLVGSDRELSCDDPSITYTTHGDFRYLDNLVPVVERWKGPVSIALYVPGSDLSPTLQRIAYMRECTTPLIKEWVSFHLFSDTKYFQDPITVWDSLQRAGLERLCTNIPDFGDQMPSFRNSSKLLYPVNVGRNVAREQAQTNFILTSDLELYPSLNFIPRFFEMLSRDRDFFLNRTVPFVFVLPIFEVAEGIELPDGRDTLIELINGNRSVTFHRNVCQACHEVPHYAEWLQANATRNQLNVFYTAKRQLPFKKWEPIFVSSNDVPFYDERLSWEGLRDKMSQSYTLCVLDYDFMILDSAFLVHRPGIKGKRHNSVKPKEPKKQNNRILTEIKKEIKKRYGERKGCSLLHT